MMKTDYISRARKFLNQIFPYISSDLKNVIKVSEGVKRFNKDYHRKVIFDSGCVRCVLITSDYVVKWDYSPYYRSMWGGCQDEVNRYKEVKKDGYDYLFAKITSIITCGKKWYIMPRINNIGSSNLNLSWAERDYINYLGITDLHENNYGSHKGKPIIIDYAATM